MSSKVSHYVHTPFSNALRVMSSICICHHESDIWWKKKYVTLWHFYNSQHAYMAIISAGLTKSTITCMARGYWGLLNPLGLYMYYYLCIFFLVTWCFNVNASTACQHTLHVSTHCMSAHTNLQKRHMDFIMSRSYPDITDIKRLQWFLKFLKGCQFHEILWDFINKSFTGVNVPTDTYDFIALSQISL